MTIDDKYDLYTLVFSLLCLCSGLLNQLFAPLHCVDIFRLAHCCPMLNPPMALLASCPLLQWRKASPPKHTINLLKDNEKNKSNTKTKLLRRKASPIKHTIMTFPTNCLLPSLYSQSGNQRNNFERCYIVGHMAL